MREGEVMIKTPGQIAYEADVALMPLYHDGARRKSWDQLRDYEQATWEKNPTPRKPPSRTA